MTEERKQELAKNGTVQHNRKTLYLLQQAYVNNKGTHGDVCYNANAIDEDGNEYYITWDTTKTWDALTEGANMIEAIHQKENNSEDCLSEKHRLDQIVEKYGDPEIYNFDESDACDWDNPSEIEER